MIVMTVADLIASLNTLVLTANQATTPIASQDGQLGFKVWDQNNTIIIKPASDPGEHIGE